MPEGTTTNKVVQLKDPDTKEPISPVVNVGSIYDKNGKKVDNLLSYTIAGTDVPVPEIPSLKDQIKNELDGTVDAATLGGSTKEEIIASVPAPDLSNVNAAKLNGYTKDQIVSEAKTNVNATQLEGHPASYFAPASAIPNLAGFGVQLLANQTYDCSDYTQRTFMNTSQIPENAYAILYVIDIANTTRIGNENSFYTIVNSNQPNSMIASAYNSSLGKANGYFRLERVSAGSNGTRTWASASTKTFVDSDLPTIGHSVGLSGTANIKVYAFCIG